jgi:signal transduction histidine kinase
VSRAVLSVTRHLGVREVLQTIVTSARNLLDAEYAALGVPDEGDSFAEFLVDGVTDEQWRRIGPLPRRHGMLGVMLHEARPQRLPDVRADPRFEGWPSAHPELVDFLGMPIRDGEDILGAIYLANKRSEGGFTADDEYLLAILAAHAAIALTNARLYERSRELSIISERTRIARDLHDAITQKLFGLRLTVQAAASLVDRDPGQARAELEGVQELASEALAELRAIIVELRPAGLDDGLVTALRKHVEVLDRVSAPAVRFHAGDVPSLPAEQEDVVLRVAQEAVHNALRHAQASSVTVRLVGSATGVRLDVQDDGTGFDSGQAGSGRHLGLASMRERAHGVGGRVRFVTAPGAGTTVRLEVPGKAPDQGPAGRPGGAGRHVPWPGRGDSWRRAERWHDG